MIKAFKKGVGQYFGSYREWTSKDFDCHCKYFDCEQTLVDLDLIAALEQIVDTLGRMRINSAFRCAKHNKDVGGLPDSQHLLGKAFDLASSFVKPRAISLTAERIPVFANGGIGLYSHFVHLDTRGTKARWGAEINC